MESDGSQRSSVSTLRTKRPTGGSSDTAHSYNCTPHTTNSLLLISFLCSLFVCCFTSKQHLSTLHTKRPTGWSSDTAHSYNCTHHTANSLLLISFLSSLFVVVLRPSNILAHCVQRGQQAGHQALHTATTAHTTPPTPYC